MRAALRKPINMDYKDHLLSSQNQSLLKNVAEDVFDYRIDFELLKQYLAQASHITVLAVASEQVVGQLRGIAHFQPDEPAQIYIDNLGVAPMHKRSGIGRGLVKSAVTRGTWPGLHLPMGRNGT